jgi:hypothetical protein
MAPHRVADLGLSGDAESVPIVGLFSLFTVVNTLQQTSPSRSQED